MNNTNGRAPLLAPADVRARRLKICAACPKRTLMPLANTPVCGACGCVLSAKTRLSRATCPLGKW